MATLAVHFPINDTNDNCPHLQYISGSWERVVDFEIYRVRCESSGWLWWSKTFWVVERFAGADTAAIGGGAVWYERALRSEGFAEERDAIIAMGNITDNDEVRRYPQHRYTE